MPSAIIHSEDIRALNDNLIAALTGSGGISKLVATNASRQYELILITGTSTDFQVALDTWKTNNPTFIPLAYERVSLDGGDYMMINYTS